MQQGSLLHSPDPSEHGILSDLVEGSVSQKKARYQSSSGGGFSGAAGDCRLFTTPFVPKAPSSHRSCKRSFVLRDILPRQLVSELPLV